MLKLFGHEFLFRSMKAAAIALVILLAIAAVVMVLRVDSIPSSSVDQAKREIMMLSAAIESYKIDHDHYPTDPASTERFKPNAAYDAAAYEAASAFLYRALWRMDETDPANRGSYANDFPAKWLRTDKKGVVHIVDLHGNYIGYSTFKAVHPESPDGYNPTFDLWSTAGNKKQVDQAKWAKNW